MDKGLQGREPRVSARFSSGCCLTASAFKEHLLHNNECILLTAGYDVGVFIGSLSHRVGCGFVGECVSVCWLVLVCLSMSVGLLIFWACVYVMV